MRGLLLQTPPDHTCAQPVLWFVDKSKELGQSQDSKVGERVMFVSLIGCFKT